ncbi:MAG: hypothetical protein JNM36_09690 [Chitinophagales bacterium]|nr:hypothetical protein [Chitinophagales bacterium]
MSLILAFSSVSIYAQVSGTVFRDFNSNGTKDNTSPLNEVGLIGVVITAYDAAGTSVGTATSAADGTYTIPNVSGTLRIEFTGLQIGDYSSFAGGTSVQFVTAPVSGVNFAVNYPADYSQPNPTVVVPTFIWGAPNGEYPDSAVVRAAPYNQRINPFPQPVYTTLATHGQVGSVYGQAYNKQNGDRYFSAFLKRYSGFGLGNIGANGSPGAIYKINSSGLVSVLLDLPASEIGTNPHPNTSTNFLSDPAWWEVGKMSWGDIDISDDGTQLFAMNLYNRKLYVINTSTGAVLSSHTIPGISGGPAWTGPTSDNETDLRPFAVKYYREKVYVGIICSAESEIIEWPNDDRINPHHQGFVFEFTPGTGFSTTPVLNFQLNGNDATYTYLQKVNNFFNYGYLPWKNQTKWLADGGNWNNLDNAMKVVISDIEFLNGDMIIGTRDLRKDLYPGQDGTKFPDGITDIPGYYATDGSGARYWKACKSGNSWVIENNGSCGGASGYNNITYYEQDNGHPTGDPMGALAIYAPEQSIVVTAQAGSDAGYTLFVTEATKQYAIGNGEQGNGIYRDYSSPPGQPVPVFRKTNGLGDVELMASPPPLEIGNRVWTDTDSDGVQDANEAGIDGITVLLFEGSTQVGTTTTANGGQWYFNDSNTTGGLKPNTAYTVRVQSSAFPSGQSLTNANADGTTNGDLRDSDASLVSGNAEIAYTTSDYGKNDHTLDMGFRTALAVGSVGNYVWFDANSDGLNNEPTTAGINGVTIELWNADTNTMLESTITANDGSNNPGYYNFIITTSGNYYIHFPTTNNNHVLTAQNPTAAIDDNSDANTITGNSATFAININGTGTDKDNPTIDGGYKCPTGCVPISASKRTN